MGVMKAGKTLALTLIAAAGIASALAGCTKEDVKTKYLSSGFVLKRSPAVEKARREHAELMAAKQQG